MSSLVSSINNYIILIKAFFKHVISIGDYIVVIFKTVWYALTSLLTSAYDLIHQVLDGSLLTYVTRGFSYLSFYIGVPATIFIVSLFLVVLLRIGISFVFKLFRLNLDYNTLKSRSSKFK